MTEPRPQTDTELVAAIRKAVDGAKEGTAMAWISAFAEVRDVLYPDTVVAQICGAERERREIGFKYGVCLECGVNRKGCETEECFAGGPHEWGPALG
jgi:hypothetical protein